MKKVPNRYDPTTRSMNLVAEGDFREQIIEQHKKYQGARILLFAGYSLKSFAKEQLENGVNNLLGEEKKNETEEQTTTDQDTTYPTSFNPRKVFVFHGAKKYTFD